MVVSLPKNIKGKFFQLDHVPHMVTWSETVYSFTQSEFDNCDKYEADMFCHVPLKTTEVMNSCIYGLVNELDWKHLSKVCPLRYVQQPDDVLEFSNSHMIFFSNTEKYATLMCQNKTLIQKLEGSGVIQIPTLCRVKVGNKLTYTKNHVSEIKYITSSLFSSQFDTDLSHILPLIHVTNIHQNVSSLWDDAQEIKDQKLIEQDLRDVSLVYTHIGLGVEGLTWAFYTLSIIIILLIGVIFMLFYLHIKPKAAIALRRKLFAKGHRSSNRSAAHAVQEINESQM